MKNTKRNTSLEKELKKCLREKKHLLTFCLKVLEKLGNSRTARIDARVWHEYAMKRYGDPY